MSVRTAIPQSKPEEASTATGLPNADGNLAGPTASLTEINAGLKKFLYENENKTLAEAFETFERKTGTKREYAAYGAGFIIACYLIVGSCAELLCNLIGFAYPAYVSVKAIRTEDKSDDTQWLTYWCCFAAFSLVDFFAERICHVLPIYWLLKTIFLLYLALPQTRGAQIIYAKYVDPAVTKIDAYWASKSQ